MQTERRDGKGRSIERRDESKASNQTGQFIFVDVIETQLQLLSNVASPYLAGAIKTRMIFRPFWCHSISLQLTSQTSDTPWREGCAKCENTLSCSSELQCLQKMTPIHQRERRPIYQSTEESTCEISLNQQVIGYSSQQGKNIQLKGGTR